MSKLRLLLKIPQKVLFSFQTETVIKEVPQKVTSVSNLRLLLKKYLKWSCLVSKLRLLLKVPQKVLFSLQTETVTESTSKGPV